MSIYVPEPVDSTVDFETLIQRRNTTAFIAADPVDLGLRRATRVATDSGGFRETRPDEPNVAPQRFRMIPQSDKTEEVRTLSGRMALPKFVLLCEWDADVKEGDLFEFGGIDYEVAQKRDPYSNKPYEQKADIVIWVNS